MKIDFEELYERFFKDVYLFVLAMRRMNWYNRPVA